MHQLLVVLGFCSSGEVLLGQSGSTCRTPSFDSLGLNQGGLECLGGCGGVVVWGSSVGG